MRKRIGLNEDVQNKLCSRHAFDPGQKSEGAKGLLNEHFGSVPAKLLRREPCAVYLKRRIIPALYIATPLPLNACASRKEK
eukprot:1144723-Pelagomonas_calceolata.AAC.4